MPRTLITRALRERRAAAGWSQAALAEAIGVSRQALAAVEAGRSVPSTAIALALGRALGCSVEELFQLPDAGGLGAVGVGDLCVGQRVVLGRVDDRWAAHAAAPQGAADGFVRAVVGGEVQVEALGERAQLGRRALVAGCAPLLGVLTARLGLSGRDAQASWLASSSGGSLALLAAGLVHFAGIHLVSVDQAGGHGPLVARRFPGQEMALVHLCRWRQGIVVAPGNPLGLREVAQLGRPGLRVVRREAGAGAQRLIERLLGEAGLDPARVGGGGLASDHADVARRVRWGLADAGVAIEAAARDAGLDFLPLSEERFDLVLPSRRLGDAPVQRLLDTMQARAFRVDAEHLPGYDVSALGELQRVPA